jgi:hypothetical protein
MKRVRLPILALLAALAAAASWQATHRRPLRIRVVRTARATTARTDRLLREVVAGLGDALAAMADEAPSGVGIALPWEVLCHGEHDAACAQLERDQTPDVTVVIAAEPRTGDALDLHATFVGPAMEGPPVDVAWDGREDQPWTELAMRLRQRLGFQAADDGREAPHVAERRRLLQAALAGTTVESTAIPLATPADRWWHALVRRDATPPASIGDFLGRYAGAWTARASDGVAALETAMTDGEHADVDRYLASAPRLRVAFSDVSSIAHGDDALVSAWRTDTSTPDEGESITVRAHVVLQLRRRGGDWVVVEQGRPNRVQWTPRETPLPRPTRAPGPPTTTAAPIRPTPPRTTTTTLPELPSIPRWHTDPSPAASLWQRGLSVDEIADLAFGPGMRGRTSSWRQPPWAVMSSAPGFAGGSVMPLLDAAYRLVRGDFPFLGDASEPAVLLVFDTRAAQAAFLARLGERLHTRFDFGNLANVGGESVLGIGMTWVEDIAPENLPTICLHESVHALTAQLFGIDQVASWFSEGVARRAELVILDPDAREHVQAVLAQNQIPPLAELMNAAHIPAHGYLPAALLIDWLLDDPLRRSQLPLLFRDARAERRPDLLALLQRRMGLGADALERQWREWLQRRFG